MGLRANGNRKVARLFRRVEKKLHILYNDFMAFKVVETSMVTDEELERVLNEWTAKGWSFSSIHFVTSDSSRRPKMAFVFFAREDGYGDTPGEARP